MADIRLIGINPKSMDPEHGNFLRCFEEKTDFILKEFELIEVWSITIIPSERKKAGKPVHCVEIACTEEEFTQGYPLMVKGALLVTLDKVQVDIIINRA